MGVIPPYGYRKDENGALIIDDVSAKEVQRIFAMYIREVQAKFAETFLSDQKTVETLARTERTFAQWIRDFVNDLRTRLVGTPYEKELLKIRNMYDKALRASDSTTQSDRQFSINPNFANEYDKWDKKPSGGYFKLGTTSKAFESIGINPSMITFDRNKIYKILQEHREMTDEIIKQIPKLLEDPILIIQSITVPNRVVAMGEVYANGKPVVCALELKPNGNIENVIKVASAYSRNNSQEFINSSDILYIKPDKNRTNNWFQALRLQLPAGVTSYGSIGTVTYYENKVNNDNSIMKKAFERAEALSGKGKKSINTDILSIEPMLKHLPRLRKQLEAEGRIRPATDSKAFDATRKVENPRKASHFQSSYISSDTDGKSLEDANRVCRYLSSVDEGVKSFAEQYITGTEEKFKRKRFSEVSERQAADIERLTGINVEGYDNGINKNGIEHIKKRHGANGEADSTMADINDIARIPYVIENYDSVELVRNEDGSVKYSVGYAGADNKKAPLVRFSKQVDGTVCVVEAITDGDWKAIWVETSYITKKGASRVLDTVRTAPSSQSPETPHTAAPFSETNITQSAGGVNNNARDGVNATKKGSSYVSDAETPHKTSYNAHTAEPFSETSIPKVLQKSQIGSENTAFYSEGKADHDDYNELDILSDDFFEDNDNYDAINEKTLDAKEKDPSTLNDVKTMLDEVEKGDVGIVEKTITLSDIEVAQALGNPKSGFSGYNQTLDQVLDAVSGKNKQVIAWVKKNIADPIYKGKADYSKSTHSMLKAVQTSIVDKLGIQKGSRESAAIMWYGEGRRIKSINEKTDEILYEDYTIDDLKRDFKGNWSRIMQAEKSMRQVYDHYVKKINASLEVIYPDPEGKFLKKLNNAKKEKVELISEAETIAQSIRSGNATAESLKVKKEEIKEINSKIYQLQRQYDSGEYLKNKRLFPRKDYFYHFMEMEKGFEAFKNIANKSHDIDPKLVGVSDFTKPKAKWQGILQERRGGAYVEDAIGGIVKYIPQAEYAININPVIAVFHFDKIILSESNCHSVRLAFSFALKLKF